MADPGSTWRATYIFVGDNNCTNSRLLVANGGRALLSNDLEIGNNVSAVSNLVAVTDAGSLISNAFTTYVGVFGRGNTLGISNQAAVFGRSAYIGLSSPFNRVIVAGTNSMWSNSVSLTVGSDENSNRLEVINGGTVVSGTGLVGGTVSTLSNSASISGPGSKWIIHSGLAIGNAGRGNMLIISNQGNGWLRQQHDRVWSQFQQ